MSQPQSLATSPPAGQDLAVRTGKDGSFSLWSEAFGEGFHSGRGALREARETFLNPSQLERFGAGSTIRVLEVCLGTGSNLAVLLEACAASDLRLDWIGLELDPKPLRLALSQPAFRSQWLPQTQLLLDQLLERNECHGRVEAPAGDDSGGAGGCPPSGSPSRLCIHGRILWGDARQSVRQLQNEGAVPFDLIWHDAFSPQRCPQLWSVQFLADLRSLLQPKGRWISYCAAAAVREALQLSGLQLRTLQTARDGNSAAQAWSGGTLASLSPLPVSTAWRELSEMERQHLASSAGEPYRDPTGCASAAQILVARRQAQAQALADGSRASSSAWRRCWGLKRQQARPPQLG